MNEYTPIQFVKLLKVLDNMSIDDFYEMFDRDSIKDADTYFDNKFLDMRKDFFQWVCSLDENNQARVFDYADKKAVWTKLKR